MTDLAKFSTSEIKAMLVQEGYNVDDIVRAQYDYMGYGAVAVYKMVFNDYDTGEKEVGKIYVSVENGKTVARY